jgi:hypothetical protein
MKTRLMALMLMAGGAMFAQTRVSIGVQIGPRPVYGYAPVAPPVAVAYRPPCPGPGYVWIDGYRDDYGDWFDGYWTLPPYVGAYWIAPRFVGRSFYPGYWNGPRGRSYYRAPVVRGYDRGVVRGYDRGYDRGSDRWNGRSNDRGNNGRGNGNGRNSGRR